MKSTVCLTGKVSLFTSPGMTDFRTSMLFIAIRRVKILGYFLIQTNSKLMAQYADIFSFTLWNKGIKKLK